MSQQKDPVKRSPAPMAPDPESPFLTAELFAAESTPEWEHRLAELQQENPFRDAFALGEDNASELMAAEALFADESYEFAGENGAEPPRFRESAELAEFESAVPWALETGTAANSGLSSLAVHSIKDWGVRNNRPEGWRRRVYGLVVHTTGSDAPRKAKREGISPTEWAVRHYKNTRGCHYVNGWGGEQAGDLVQVANEDLQAWGVGVTNKKERAKDQRRSIARGRFEKDLPPILVTLWRKRWPNH
ncbi:MAG: hypothetical protein R3293_23740, partial [Candidatus Promineifilaceae bacterium]|nr:hypothetical protein [Candidatus Promineifilaceae bacterium]